MISLEKRDGGEPAYRVREVYAPTIKLTERTSMGFFARLQERFSEFMVGRNGMDTLARYFFYAGLILTIINVFVGNIILSTLALFCLLYSLFRCFSRNHSARQSENEKAESFMEKPRSWFSRKKNAGNTGTNGGTAGAGTGTAANAAGSNGGSDATPTLDEANNIYFACSNCGQSLSVPRGKGTLRVTCPKCHQVTTVKS